jgi:hypothetical protein
MKLKDCCECEHFIDTMTDCVLCRKDDEIEQGVVDKDNVVSCPLEK